MINKPSMEYILLGWLNSLCTCCLNYYPHPHSPDIFLWCHRHIFAYYAWMLVLSRQIIKKNDGFLVFMTFLILSISFQCGTTALGLIVGDGLLCIIYHFKVFLRNTKDDNSIDRMLCYRIIIANTLYCSPTIGILSGFYPCTKRRKSNNYQNIPGIHMV